MTCQFVTGMVGINKHAKVDITSMRLRRIKWDWFLHVPIKFFPVTLLKHTHIDIRIVWMENNMCIMSAFKICENMEHCFQMSFMWECQKGRQGRNFCYDVNPSQFHTPMKHSNLRLIKGGLVNIQLRCDIQFGLIVSWEWCRCTFQ